jgi:regulator of RNase E activity RraA
MVASGIHIQSVDNKSRDLGGAITVLFLLHEKEIAAVIDSLTSGRILVVRNAL